MTDADRRADRQAPDADRWLTVSQAALTVGVSERRIRRWLSAGRLPARDGDGRRLVALADVRRMTDADRQPTVIVADRATVTDGQGGHPDGQPSELSQALAFIERQQQTIMELSGRVGWLQSENQRLQEEVRLLKAPAAKTDNLSDSGTVPDLPSDPALAPTSNHPALSANGQDSDAQQAQRRPWWRRWAARVL